MTGAMTDEADETAQALVAAGPTTEELEARRGKTDQFAELTAKVDVREWTYSWYCARWGAKDQGEKISVRCGACAMPSFTIRYGNHECIATCTNCGHEQTVYDG